MILKTPVELKPFFDLRKQFEKAFAPETASDRIKGDIKSAGHCRVTSVLLHYFYNAKMMSTYINGQLHWYNRLHYAGDTEVFELDVDLTGDQFGLAPVMLKENLYVGSQNRRIEEVPTETLNQALTFAEKVRLGEYVTSQIRKELKSRDSKFL